MRLSNVQRRACSETTAVDQGRGAKRAEAMTETEIMGTAFAHVGRTLVTDVTTSIENAT